MATFRIKDLNEWLPAWLRGTGGAVTKIRVSHHDGTRVEHTVVPETSEITTEDARAIRHLEADPRFTRIS